MCGHYSDVRNHVISCQIEITKKEKEKKNSRKSGISGKYLCIDGFPGSGQLPLQLGNLCAEGEFG